MLSRLRNATVCKYSPDVPVERLRRHHVIASRICMLGMGSGALMISSTVEFLVSHEGWGRTISMAVLLTSAAVSGVMMIPSILAWAWGEEIEREFSCRGLPLPDGGRLRKYIPRTAMKMFYWFVVILLIGYFS